MQACLALSRMVQEHMHVEPVLLMLAAGQSLQLIWQLKQTQHTQLQQEKLSLAREATGLSPSHRHIFSVVLQLACRVTDSLWDVSAGNGQADVFDDEAGGWKRQGRGRKRAVTRGQATVQVCHPKLLEHQPWLGLLKMMGQSQIWGGRDDCMWM